ncbi:MAG TPA: MauE/DoxX family redox-associated membrane protein [Verrucomicrobiae bacterium]|nr:MauE/DoxX family redox-associated membrane protein [Verrucomicrobiae bacterium]
MNRAALPRVLLRLLVGGTFLVAGASKVAEPARFAGTIAAYGILSPFSASFAAALLPWVEMAAGGALAAGRRTGGAAAVLVALTLVFLAVLGHAIAGGAPPDCGCFGGSGGSAWGAVARDLLLLAGGAYLLHGEAAGGRGYLARDGEM